MVNILVLLGLAALAAVFFVLARRAWRSRNALVRFPGTILSGLLGLVLLAVTAVGAYGFYRMNYSPHAYSKNYIPVTGAGVDLERGERLANICAGCHSQAMKLPLDGSADNFLSGEDVPPLGEIWATDLTPSGPIKDWSDAQIARAIREGVDAQNRPLFVMPSMAFHEMSDEDVMSLVAYLRTMPPSGRVLPERDLNIVAALFVGAGMFPMSDQEPINEPILTPEHGTVAYGEYISLFAGCRDCHGATLSGEPGPFGLAGPNLRAEIDGFTREQFLNFFTTGKLPEGRVVSTDSMPWMDYRNAFTDDELGDLYDYLVSLP